MIRKTLLQQILPTLRLVLFLLLSMMLVVAAACGDDEEETEPEPTEPPAEGPEPGFEPEMLYRVEVSDEHTVNSVAYSPDGNLIAVGTFMEVHLIDAQTGETVRVIEFDHSVADLEFSPDGSLIAGGQGVYGAQLKNVDDGSDVIQLHGGYDNYLAFAPDGETIATGNRTGDVWIWDVQTGEQIAEYSPPESEFLLSLAYAPDGNILAHGNWDGHVFLWDTDDGSLIRTLENPEDFGYAYDLAFSTDGEYLAVAGTRAERDDVVRIWLVDDGSEHATIGTDRQTRAVAFSPDGNLLALGSDDRFMIVTTEGLVTEFQYELDVDTGDSNWVTGVAFSPDSRMLALSYWDGSAELWHIQE